MPNTIIFSESIEGLSIRKGDFYLGTNDVGKGPTSLTGFYNGYPVGNYSYIIYLRRITNIFPRSGTTLAFTDAYNGSSYGFGSGTNIQQEFQDNLRPESTTRVTKVSRINSNVSQMDYVYIGLDSPQNSTRIVSFWYYGTYGTGITPYNNDGSANLSYLNASKNWVAGTTTGFPRYVDIPVTVNVWQKIVVRIVNNGSTGVGLTWLILHSNVETPTLANTEYWAFSEFIYEQKPLNCPSVYVCQNDEELILRTNQIDRSTVRTTVESCFEYFSSQSDKMVVNKDYDLLITNGLKFFLDASFVTSYPRTGNTWYDLGDSANNATLQNGALYLSDGSIDLDGTNDYISTTYGKNINPFNNPLTITVTIKPDDINTNQMFISTGQSRGNADSNQRFYISIYNGYWDWGIRTSSWGGGNISANTRWNEITICVDSTSARFYLNSNQIYTKSVNNTYVLNDNFWFGGHDSGGNYPFNGRISTTQIYNRALSVSEISQNYYKGSIVTNGLVLALDANNLVSYDKVGNSWYNLSGSTNTGTLNNSPTFIDQNIKSFEFDGTNDYIDCQNDASLNFGTTSLTVSAWYQRYDSAASNLRILAKGAGDDSTPGFALFGGNTNLSFIISDSPTRKSIGTTTSLNLNTWYYVTGVVNRASNSLSIFINGIVQNSRSDLTSTTLTGNSNLYIGANVPGSVLWKGLISGVKIYNRALSASEILQNFNAHRSRYGI